MLEVLREQENFRSAQQLYLDIRQRRPLQIGLTSVYRILRALADDRIAETQRAEDGEILYRLRTRGGSSSLSGVPAVRQSGGIHPRRARRAHPPAHPPIPLHRRHSLRRSVRRLSTVPNRPGIRKPHR